MRPLCRLRPSDRLFRSLQQSRLSTRIQSHHQSTLFVHSSSNTPSRGTRTSHRPSQPRPHQSAFNPVALLVGITFGVAVGYFYPSTTTEHEEKDTAVAPNNSDTSNSSELLAPSDTISADMAALYSEGRPGNLTPEQEVKLKEMWLQVLDIFGVHKEQNLAVPGSASSSPAIGGESPNLSKDKRKSRMSWFGKSSSKEKDEPEDEDKHGQNKEFKQALASQKPEDLRNAFWSMVKHDDPDAILLRYLRARKWDVHAALVMMIATMHWRGQVMHLDDRLMAQGDSGFLKQTKTATGQEKKDAEDFMTIMRKGLSVIYGTDNQGRPVTTVRVQKHHPNEQSDKAIEDYTVWVIETARMTLRSPVDMGTIVFDMNGFGMANMDYTPVKFMIKCFEANYPESLGCVLVYKAPWIFQGIWKIIKGWLDPVVASKVHFCSDEKELANYINKDQIMTELGGPKQFHYEYVEPREGENKAMQDTAARSQLENERKSMVDVYEKDTVAWAKNEQGAGQQREKLKPELRNNYWKLDPYVRATGLYDRIGMLGEGGKLDMFPSMQKIEAAKKGEEVHPDLD